QRLMISSSRYAAANSGSGPVRSSMISLSAARCAKLSHISQNDRCIFGAETDAVCERVPHARLARSTWDIVEVAVFGGILQVQCRRYDAFFHGKQDSTDAGGTTSPLRMSDHRFRCTHRNAVGTFFETAPDGFCFDPIVEIRGCTVEIHVIDVVNCEISIA